MHLNDQTIIIVTGTQASGKTTLLKSFYEECNCLWKIIGFLSMEKIQRTYQSAQGANEYELNLLPTGEKFDWAKKNSFHGFTFSEETREIVTDKLLVFLKNKYDILVLDNLGNLETKGQGFKVIIENAMNRTQGLLILSCPKSMLEKFLDKFNIKPGLTIDLDKEEFETSRNKLINFIHSWQAEKIGLYAALLASVEVSFGSILHALQIPFSGHFLAFIQAFLLTIFGKPLKGRGLYLMSFISAALKSFSPAGGKIRPMFYIFIQGVSFALPTTFLGWNFFSVWFGSILLAWTTVGLFLGINSLLYGTVIFDAYTNMINKGLTLVHLQPFTFWNLIWFILVFKTIVASLLFLVAWFFPVEKIFNKATFILKNSTPQKNKPIPTLNWRQAAQKAFTDLLTPFFLTSFLIIILMLSFFTELSRVDLTITLIRAVILAWFGFLISRKINFVWIESKLRKIGRGQWASSLNHAVRLLRKTE